jgi:hypothetical protein
MSSVPNIDGILIQWGDRLFYPGNRIVKAQPQRKLSAGSDSQRAAAIRAGIRAAVVRRAPQVMVKVTGGGRGMKAIAAHFRYISKNGRLEIEDDRGQTVRGRDSLSELADEWRFGGTLIGDRLEPGQRREAFNIMLSMPRGTDPLSVQYAAREFARVELADHKYVMVLHDHQANPHVHISVRAESRKGKRLNPRKADLRRWREVFAEKLRERGIEAEATRRAPQGRGRNDEALWRIKAEQEGRLRSGRPPTARNGGQARGLQAQAVEAWTQIGRALAASSDPRDRELAQAIDMFMSNSASEPSGRQASRPNVGAPAREPSGAEPRR